MKVYKPFLKSTQALNAQVPNVRRSCTSLRQKSGKTISYFPIENSQEILHLLETCNRNQQPFFFAISSNLIHILSNLPLSNFLIQNSITDCSVAPLCKSAMHFWAKSKPTSLEILFKVKDLICFLSPKFRLTPKAPYFRLPLAG